MHSQTTLMELLPLYLDAREGELESSTVYHTRRAWTVMLESVGDGPVEDFGPVDAEHFRSVLLRTYRPATAQSYLKTVRPVFRWWYRRHIAGPDPFANLTPVRVPLERPVIIPDADILALRTVAGQTDRDRARIVLAQTTGMRRGELYNLTWADIDFEHEVIHVQPKKETPATWRWVPKDKDARVVPLTAEAADLLRCIQFELPIAQPYALLSKERYAYLQMRRQHGWMTDRQRKCPDENAKPFRRAREKAGVPRASLRHLRSTYLTKLADNGIPPHVVQAIAGHSSIATTQRYYLAVQPTWLDKARAIGATGLEPATS